MKIKVYIVTYNNDEILKKNLNLLIESDLKNYDHEINVVNNYSVLKGFDDYKINIFDNTIRPDFSCGHLSRSWNMCLISGFKSIPNPDTDICVLMQNDTFVLKDTFSNIIQLHDNFDFIQSGAGDQLMSFNINSIKKSGIFDERFNSIAYQEADFFTNAIVTNPDRVTINDPIHGRRHNKIDIELVGDEYTLNKESYHISNVFGYHDYNRKLFKTKWGIDPDHWSSTHFNIVPKIKRYMFYPYFEMDIENLNKMNYYI
jgi:hypothetical protein